MSGGGVIIIQNGTLRRWLTYVVVFGGKPAPVPGNEYALAGGVRVYGWVLVLGAIALTAAVCQFT